MVNTKIRLIIFFATKDGEAIYSQQKQDQELTWSCVESNAFLGHSKAEVASLVPQMVKNLPVMWEIWVRSLDWEDPLEEGMATHSNILSWETEEPGGLQSMG